jgi:hypothetical protein
VYLIQYFDPTFNNISVILWQSFLLVEETWGPGENHDLSHNVVHLALIEIQTINGDRHYIQSRRPLVVIGIDCIGSCKSNYHTTKVGSLNPAHREVYLIQYFVIKFVIGDLSRFWWSYLGPLVYLLTKLLNYFAFQPFDFERTWWRLFQNASKYCNAKYPWISSQKSFFVI